MRISGKVMILLSILTASLAAAGEGPVAVVAELSGSGTVERGAEAAPLALFDRLRVGDEVEISGASTAVVAFAGGQRYRIEASTRVAVAQAGLEAVHGSVKTLEPVATVPAIEAIPTAQRPGQRSGALRIRSGSLWGTEVEDLYPRDGATTLADETVLTFRSLLNTETYRVDVEDEVGETVFAVETRANSVVIPKGVLLPGTEYYWRVRSAGRRAIGGRGEALFATLSVEQCDARSKLREQTEREGSLSASLLQAEVDRSLGLYREACASLERAVAMAGDNEHIAAASGAFMCDTYGTAE